MSFEQNRIAFRNWGCINPENIDGYIQNANGYRGLIKAQRISRAAVIDELRKAGLRGRGGGGFSTAEKWQTCYDAGEGEKYIICNAVDADPKSQIARLLADNDPHSVLEGILIGAYTIGAWRGFICINREYENTIDRLEKALEQIKKHPSINTGCNIEIKKITPSLVSGEETALICSLEGKQAMPYRRTEYPAVKGLNGKPTLVNNVETFSHVSAILQNDPEWYAAFGTEGNRGTKIINLYGDSVINTTTEVPLGTTLRTIITSIGGLNNLKDIKAMQVGGPTGNIYPAASLDMPLDFETIFRSGGIIGSGTIQIFDNSHCAVEMARAIMSYLQTQSCGKCILCREGTNQMADILTDISEGRGNSKDLDLLIEIGEAMQTGSICGLGKTASNPFLSSIRHFRADYDIHINEKRCPKIIRPANHRK
jgi:NADH:ubiquinone oxidoreductase subunit F (NADH-binding)